MCTRSFEWVCPYGRGLHLAPSGRIISILQEEGVCSDVLFKGRKQHLGGILSLFLLGVRFGEKLSFFIEGEKAERAEMRIKLLEKMEV